MSGVCGEIYLGAPLAQTCEATHSGERVKFLNRNILLIQSDVESFKDIKMIIIHE